MICPKCQNPMRTVDKNGVHIDQCEGCRGIFLDRGELEQIAGAETAFYGGQAPPAYQPDAPAPPGYQPVPPPPPRGYADSPRGYRGGYSDSPRPYGGHGHGRGHHGQRRRKSFLEQLFD